MRSAAAEAARLPRSLDPVNAREENDGMVKRSDAGTPLVSRMEVEGDLRLRSVTPSRRGTVSLTGWADRYDT